MLESIQHFVKQIDLSNISNDQIFIKILQLKAELKEKIDSNS